MHIEEGFGNVSRHSDSHIRRELNCFLQVQQVIERPGHIFKGYYNVGDLWYHTHKQGNIWMPYDTLHDNLVIYLVQQFVGEAWIENLFESNRCSVKQPLMNYRESTLRNLLTDFNVVHGNLSDTSDLWKAAGSN